MSFSFTTELKFVASAYTKQLGAKITSSTVEEKIEQNPYFPSLYSLAQTFNKYKIENNGYNIPLSEFDRYDIEAPFVAYVKFVDKTVDDFILVTDMDEEYLTYIYNSNKKQKLAKNVFLGKAPETNDDLVIYRGTIFKAKLTEHSGDPHYHNNKTAENKIIIKKFAALAGAVLLIVLATAKTAPINSILPFISIVFIKLIGLFTTGLILIHDNDRSNAFVKNICSISPKTNCDAVLSSAAAKIGGVNMGEISLVYFSSTLIGLFFPNLNFAIKLFCISAANIIVVPYIFFSIYYQRTIVKTWCPLCLTVQAILLSEFIWSFALFWKNPYIPVLGSSLLYIISFCISLPVIIWHYVKPRLTKAMNHDLYYSAYKRLQLNPDIFNKLLSSQPTTAAGWENIGLDVGNPNAEHVLIKICNPYCGPCSKAHIALHELLENNSNIRLKIIFVTRNSIIDKGRPVVKHLLALAENKVLLREALDAWYLSPEKNYDEFAEKFPVNQPMDQQEVKIDAMRNWCDTANIHSTPTFFLNGFMLPENYGIEELAYII